MSETPGIFHHPSMTPQMIETVICKMTDRSVVRLSLTSYSIHTICSNLRAEEMEVYESYVHQYKTFPNNFPDDISSLLRSCTSSRLGAEKRDRFRAEYANLSKRLYHGGMIRGDVHQKTWEFLERSLALSDRVLNLLALEKEDFLHDSK